MGKRAKKTNSEAKKPERYFTFRFTEQQTMLINNLLRGQTYNTVSETVEAMARQIKPQLTAKERRS